jgi:hypothetical protein
MSTRYTKRDAEAAFERLVNAFDLQKGSPQEPGVYALDYHQGYKIIRFGKNGSEYEPFGARRYTAAEFVHACGFAIDALYESRRQEA